MTRSDSHQRDRLPYLSEEELDLLIEETEKSTMITAPSFLKREVFGEIRRRRTINQMNCVRMKTWQIVTVVAAAILLLTVMPFESRLISGAPENADRPGISVMWNRSEQEEAPKRREDRVGTWMYEKNLQVGATVRAVTNQLLPAAINSRADAASCRSLENLSQTNGNRAF